MMQQAVWLHHDQASLDAAYDQRAWCPEIADRLAAYKSATAAARASLCPEALSYGPHLLDLFPARAPRRGLHLHIHGGAWRAQSRDDAGFVAPALCAAGFDVAVPDFGALPATRMPDVVEELTACVRSLAPRGPIHLSGHSSGAHYAAVLATRLPFASVTLVSGIYDLEPVLLSSRRDYVRLTPAEAHALSPLRHADRIAAPVLVAWGTAESPEFIRQSEVMAEAARARRFVLHGTDHFAAAHALASGPLHEALLSLA